MTLEEFRKQFEAHRKDAVREATYFKDPYLSLNRLKRFYKGLDDTARHMADQVLQEWAISEDAKASYDALVLIDELGINAALPTLVGLAQRLEAKRSPSAPYDLKWVNRIIARLKGEQPN
jgi:hypothetical protein